MRTTYPRAASLKLCVLALLLAVSPGCRREQPAEQPAVTGPAAAPDRSTATAVASPPKDGPEGTPFYVIGISYPPAAAQCPTLAAELRRYAEAARSELLEAAKGRRKAGSSAPYELVLP